uniref:Uncharacterized protein n=1 Tax=Anopheles maculatus TaxID=74869 RepID=A0A182TBQ1_9DIPT
MFSSGEKVQVDKYDKYKNSLDAVHQESFSFALMVCAQIRLKLIEHFATIKKKPRCSPIPYLFNRCLMEVDIANCPSDRWMNSTLCDVFMMKLKQKYGKGIQRKSS